MNVKLTREDGTDCWPNLRNKIQYKVGEIVQASNWKETSFYKEGLNFGEAATCLQWAQVAQNIQDWPARAFEVEPVGSVEEIKPGLKNAKGLRILRELDFPQLLSELANDKDWLVRLAVAKNPKTNQETLAKLAKNEESWTIREAVAENPNTDKETLSELCNDSRWYVKEGARINLEKRKKAKG